MLIANIDLPEQMSGVKCGVLIRILEYPMDTLSVSPSPNGETFIMIVVN